MSLAFTGNYAPLILSRWRAEVGKKPRVSHQTPGETRSKRRWNRYFICAPSRHGIISGSTERRTLSVYYWNYIFINFHWSGLWREERGVQRPAYNYAEYYANKNRGLLQSFHFSLSLWPKLPNQTGGSPSALDNPTLNSFIIASSKKWNGNHACLHGCKVQSWLGRNALCMHDRSRKILMLV